MVPTDGVSEALLASVGVEGQTSSRGGHCVARAAGGVRRASAQERSRDGEMARLSATCGLLPLPRPGQRSPAYLTVQVAGEAHCDVRLAKC